MPSYPFKKLDAFAVGRSAGNPAGAIYLRQPGELTPEEMLRISRECAGWVSEVGFLANTAPGEYWVRYWSAAREVDFCGHATVAIMYDLLQNDPEAKGRRSVGIRTRHDALVVENRIDTEDAVYVTAPRGQSRELRASEDEIATALGAHRHDVLGACVINAGLDTLIVEIVSLARILELAPSLEKLQGFCERIGVDILLVWSRETSKSASSFRTRVFAPRFGYLEDPATGSGNAAFGYHLLWTGEWKAGSLMIEQNGSSENPNQVRLATVVNGGETRVMFGGGAIVKVRGEYLL